jgi:hypothetical protein
MDHKRLNVNQFGILQEYVLCRIRVTLIVNGNRIIPGTVYSQDINQSKKIRTVLLLCEEELKLNDQILLKFSKDCGNKNSVGYVNSIRRMTQTIIKPSGKPTFQVSISVALN